MAKETLRKVVPTLKLKKPEKVNKKVESLEQAKEHKKKVMKIAML